MKTKILFFALLTFCKAYAATAENVDIEPTLPEEPTLLVQLQRQIDATDARITTLIDELETHKTKHRIDRESLEKELRIHGEVTTAIAESVTRESETLNAQYETLSLQVERLKSAMSVNIACLRSHMNFTEQQISALIDRSEETITAKMKALETNIETIKTAQDKYARRMAQLEKALTTDRQHNHAQTTELTTQVAYLTEQITVLRSFFA